MQERNQRRQRRSRRGSDSEYAPAYEKKVFMQLVTCCAIVVSVLLVKEITLPNGRLVGGYVKNYLSNSTNIKAVMSAAMSFAEENKLLPSGSPSPLPEETPAPDSENSAQNDSSVTDAPPENDAPPLS